MGKYYTIYDNGKRKTMPKKVKIGDKFFPAHKEEWDEIQQIELAEYKQAKTKNPLLDGSGKGTRANIGRGGCITTEKIGLGENIKKSKKKRKIKL